MLRGVQTLLLHDVHMDVKISLLSDELDEEIYTQQLTMFVVLGQVNKVYKLECLIYNLKYSPR